MHKQDEQTYMAALSEVKQENHATKSGKPEAAAPREVQTGDRSAQKQQRHTVMLRQ
jgi:hypothetical protein